MNACSISDCSSVQPVTLNPAVFRAAMASPRVVPGLRMSTKWSSSSYGRCVTPPSPATARFSESRPGLLLVSATVSWTDVTARIRVRHQRRDGPVLEGHAAPLQQRYLIGEAADLLDALCRPDDRDPGCRQTGNQLTHTSCAFGIKIVRCLIDKQDAGVREECPRHPEPLLHTVPVHTDTGSSARPPGPP